jgi:hypothetical protein
MTLSGYSLDRFFKNGLKERCGFLYSNLQYGHDKTTARIPSVCITKILNKHPSFTAVSLLNDQYV